MVNNEKLVSDDVVEDVVFVEEVVVDVAQPDKVEIKESEDGGEGEEIVTNIAKNNENICQEKPKPPQIVLRDFGDQEVIMEIRYYVPNAPLMRSTKSYYVKEILKQFEEQDVKLAYPTRLIMKEDIE